MNHIRQIINPQPEFRPYIVCKIHMMNETTGQFVKVINLSAKTFSELKAEVFKRFPFPQNVPFDLKPGYVFRFNVQQEGGFKDTFSIHHT